LSNLGLTVGIVGFSRIGRRVMERLQQLEDVSCLVSDPFADAAKVSDAGARPVALEQLLPEVDVLSIHAPELSSTYHLIGSSELAQLGTHATVINTARGSLIDTDALEAECVTGRLNAILDVTDPEPLATTSRRYHLRNVMITRHIAGSLDSEIRRMTDTALDELERFLTDDALQHEVLETDLVLHV
jgi:phosphoglycerate dehydrogenase-like enzyme